MEQKIKKIDVKQIEIIDKQKNKLLKICKYIFSEYNFSFYEPISKANMLIGYLKSNDSDIYDNCDIFIHWFEFCMYILLPEIKKYGNIEEVIPYWEFILDPRNINYKEHIIDYCYREYEKIKKKEIIKTKR